jgi:hypothetical protein
LDVDALSVPAQQRVDSVRVPQIVNTWQVPGSRADIGTLEKSAQALSQSASRAGSKTSKATHQERRVGMAWKAAPQEQIGLHLARRVRGQRDEARFVELRWTDEQSPLGGVVIGQAEAYKLAAT